MQSVISRSWRKREGGENVLPAAGRHGERGLPGRSARMVRRLRKRD